MGVMVLSVKEKNICKHVELYVYRCTIHSHMPFTFNWKAVHFDILMA